MREINLGRVTAYADAVNAGYTGTREEFAVDLANAATYAAEAGDSAAEAKASEDAAALSASTAAQAAVEAAGSEDAVHADAVAAQAAKTDAIAAKDTAVSKAGEAANSASAAGLSAAAASASETAAGAYANTASSSATSAIGSASAAAESASAAEDSATEAASALGDVTAAKTEALAAIQTKGEETLESIPEDYTALRNDVSSLKSDLRPSIYNIHVFETSGYVKPDGTFGPYAGWTRTDYIDISMCKVIAYKTSASSIYNAFYDENKDYISSFALSSGMLNNNVRTVNVPDTAVYMVLSNTDEAIADTMIYPISALSDLNKYNLLNGLVIGNRIEIEQRGTDIYVQFLAAAYVYTVRYYGNFSYGTIANGQTFTVPDGSFLVYNMETSVTSVMTFTEIQQTNNRVHLIVLMCNNNGVAVGCIKQAENTDALPYYYRTYMASKTNLINQKKSGAGVNGCSFVFITDEHMQQNAMKSNLLIENIRKETGIDTVIQGGDIITIETNKAAVYKDLSKYVSYLENTGCKVYSAIGNHEFNNPNASSDPAALDIMLTLEEVAASLYSGNTYNSCVFNASNMAYYTDSRNTRVFFLPCNYASGIYIAPVKWILAQLAEVPDGYHVIVVSHVIAEWNSDMSQSTINARLQALINGLDAVKAKQVYTYDGTTYDYSNTDILPVCVIGGHAHVDYNWMSTGGIPIIMTTSDSGEQESGGLTRTKYTTNEQAFDVVTADYTARKLYLTRIGAGQNREFDF